MIVATQHSNAQDNTFIDILHSEYGIDVAQCEDIDLQDADKYILLKDRATELAPLIEQFPSLGTAIENYHLLGQTAYSITFNGQNVLPDQLFQKSNGAFLSNLKSETGVGFGKQTDISPLDFKGAQVKNWASAVFGLASAATATYYLKNIDDKLNALQDATRNILGFLEADKLAGII